MNPAPSPASTLRMSRLARLAFPITAILALFAACLSPSQAVEHRFSGHGKIAQAKSLRR